MADFPPIRFKYTDSGLASGIQEFESGDFIDPNFISGGVGASYLSGLDDTDNVELANRGAVLVKTAVNWEPGGASVVSGTAPSSPYEGQLWLDTTTEYSGIGYLNSTSVSISYTLLNTDSVVLVDTTASAITTTLPSASSVDGKVYNIKKIAGANDVIISTQTEDTLDGNNSKNIEYQYTNVVCFSNGTDWYIL